MLSYFTRGGDTPKNKLNILLLLHRSDREIFLNDLSRDVLSILDAAVWYSNEKNETDYHLDEMNLVILPVTSVLLSDFSSVKPIFEDAKNKRIPILPIIMEELPLEEYENFFGNVQYIDRSSNDRPISYIDSLKGYLKKYEENTSLRKRIQSELDANLFVSYRHTDREIMKSLIKIIHDNPCCRDLGVWYDDMLTAGNDFNNEILDSIRSADVFVLAVTPALLEDGNYVAANEYPAAVSASIPVIPVMMVDTPIDLLREMYPGLPEICDPQKIGERISTVLGEKLDRENDSDGEHLYYVGLAYILGSSVETDVKRGINILRQSSNHGYANANRWLASLVDDETESLDYHIQFFNSSLHEFRSRGDAESILGLFDAAKGYVDHFIVRKAVDPNDIAEKLIGTIASFVVTNQIVYAVEMYYMALMLGYSYYMEIGKKEQANKYLEAAVNIVDDLYSETQLPNRLKYYVESYVKMAELQIQLENYELAEHYIITDLLPTLSSEEENTSYDNRELRELAVYVYYALYDLCYAKKDYVRAATVLQKVVELYEGLDQNNPTRDYARIIYHTNLSVVINYLRAEKIREAEEYLPILEKSQEKMLSGVSTDGRLEYDIKLLVLKARIERENKRFKSAEAYLKKAEKIARDNDQHLTEDSFHELHFAYSVLYSEWGHGKRYLSEYHNLVSFRNYSVKAAKRGTDEDYDKLADSMPKLYTKIGMSDEVKKWSKYLELAKKRNIAFYPDDSHLEEERDAHLFNLLFNGSLNLILLIIGIVYTILDYKYAFVFADKGWLCLVMMIIYYLSGPTVCEMVLYLFYRIKRKSEYTAAWAFKSAMIVKRAMLIILTLMFVSIIPLFLTTGVFTDHTGASNEFLCFVLPLICVVLTRTLRVLDKCMERERLRAFWRVSRFRPLSEQPKA